MKEPEIDIEEDSTDIEVIEIDSDTIDGAAADSDAAPNIQNVSEENEPPVQPDNEIEIPIPQSRPHRMMILK